MSKRDYGVICATVGFCCYVGLMIWCYPGGSSTANAAPQPVRQTTFDLEACAVEILASFTANDTKLAEVDAIGAHKGNKGLDPQSAKIIMAGEAIRWCEALEEAFLE